MITILWAVLLLSMLMLFYIYGGYLFLLNGLYTISRKCLRNFIRSYHEHDVSPILPNVSIYFSAYNEEETVEKRFENLLSLDYPPEKIELIMLSDGSTDNTVERGYEIKGRNPERKIIVIDFPENEGQARSQNEVITLASHDILLSTDAETDFPPDLLKNIVKPFADPRVGVVGGVVVYRSTGTSIGESYSRYRDTEREMRRLESLLNIGVKTDGPCVAYRKNLWQPIEEWEDVDQVISLFAKKKGYFTVQAEKAVCYDRANRTKEQEIRQRSRMTRKAFLSTFGRWKLRDCFRYPAFTVALLSHKIVRFFSPLFVILMIGSALGISLYYKIFGALLFSLIILAVMMAIGRLLGMKVIKKALGLLYAFLFCNIGFSLGILGWIRGMKQGKYVPTRRNV